MSFFDTSWGFGLVVMGKIQCLFNYPCPKFHVIWMVITMTLLAQVLPNKHLKPRFLPPRWSFLANWFFVTASFTCLCSLWLLLCQHLPRCHIFPMCASKNRVLSSLECSSCCSTLHRNPSFFLRVHLTFHLYWIWHVLSHRHPFWIHLVYSVWYMDWYPEPLFTASLRYHLHYPLHISPYFSVLSYCLRWHLS